VRDCMATTTLYEYPTCSTCRNAKKWLTTHRVPFKAVNIVESPPSAKKLRSLLLDSGLPIRKFFNTSGQSYRNGGFKDRLGDMTESQMLAELAADGKLIKRPILKSGAEVLVGFRPSDYADLFDA
jgi:arsenate reductase (glutaredoxin)